MALHLGPFELERPVGRGATAHVWRGRHRTTGVPVAIKVMTAPTHDRAAFGARFAREVRAVARLDHPSVVRLHDHGEVPADVAGRLEGRLAAMLPAGAPYLVMEWVGGGTLESARACTSWPRLRVMVLALLDTLAHAHARGIVHRDLKPANVLVADRGPILTDFGVAFAHDTDTDRRGGMVGTPNYMAPEQIRGDWRSMGPHTDLYALGCMTYALIAGRAPFSGRPLKALLKAHQTENWPELTPAVEIPEGLIDWLRRLGARRVSERFAFAADAAVALLAIPETPTIAPTAAAPASPDADPTIVAPPVFVPVGEPTWRTVDPEATLPPMPTTWAEPRRHRPPPPLMGVGRSLFALRVPPLVGRESERDRLWALLDDVVRRPGPRVALIEGASGHGKSRLVEWLAERVHTLGVALPIRVEHGPDRSAEWGLAAAVRRLFRCEGLKPPEVMRRIERGLAAAGTFPDRGLAAAVGAAMHRDGHFEVDGLTIRLGSPRERHAAIATALARVAARRPRVLIIDDAQWGADALGLVEQIMNGRARPPVLVAVVVRDDAVVSGSPEAEAIARIAVAPGTERIFIGPLDSATQARLLSARLPLAPAVVDALVERTEGSPLFGEELLRHWIQTDALESTPAGFRPRSGADETLPDGLRTVWWARIHRVVDGQPGRPWQSLELAATLGMVIDTGEWQAACIEARLPHPGPLAERLLDSHLVRHEDDRLVFAHAMLRETLIEHARSDGRLAEHNAVCAAVLAARGEPDPGRRARYLLGAGRRTEALPLLILTADEHLGRSEYRAAGRTLIRAARTLKAMRGPTTGPGWAAVRVRWSRMRRIRGDATAALRHARRAANSPLRPLRVRALLAAGLAEMGLGRMDDAWITLSHAVEETRDESVAPSLRSLALCRAGNCLIWLGRGDEATRLLEESLAVGDDPWPHADALLSMAEVTRRHARPGPAARLGHRALSMYREAGSRWGVAQALLILGDIDRAVDCVPEARASYTEARALCDAIGSSEGMAYADLREALALVALDRFDEARALLDGLMPSLDPRSAVLAAAYGLPGHAAGADWIAYDGAWARLEPLRASAFSEPDVVHTLRRSAELCARVGEHDRASAAADLARLQAELLGWPAR